MYTDKIPKAAKKNEEYLRSDQMRKIKLPPAQMARRHALSIKQALEEENLKAASLACNALAADLAKAYKIKAPPIRVLSVRPREETEYWVVETFGDYDPSTQRIRLWMRTAIKKKPTSYGTFLSTLIHEFCHHLDMVALDMPHSYHTRGFFERTALIYHHVQNTPVRIIVWKEHKDGTFTVDWGATMRK